MFRLEIVVRLSSVSCVLTDHLFVDSLPPVIRSLGELPAASVGLFLRGGHITCSSQYRRWNDDLEHDNDARARVVALMALAHGVSGSSAVSSRSDIQTVANGVRHNENLTRGMKGG